jgi:AcrR family transcriptional regulator
MAASRGNAPHDPTKGRKAAYFARNRIALLKSAQAVLAEHGPEATIEQFADQAQISVSTIYKHFENKDALVEAALVAAMTDWEEWMTGVMVDVTDPLEQLVTPIRLFLRMRTTHSRYAQLISRNLVAATSHVPALSVGFQEHVKALLKAGVLKFDNPELRIRNVSAAILSALQVQLFDSKSKDSTADLTVEIALGMFGLTPAKAHKIMSTPLPKFEPAPAPF